MAGIDGLISALTTQLIEALVRARSAEDKADAAVKMAADCMKEVLVLKSQSYDPFAARPEDVKQPPEAPQKLSPFALERQFKEAPAPKVAELEKPIDDASMLQSQIWGDAINDV